MDTATLAPFATVHHHVKPLEGFPSPKNRAVLIERSCSLVGFALAPLLRKWPPLSAADKDELESACLRALVLAADTFDARVGVQFSTYAVMRIQFAARRALRQRGEWKAYQHGFAVASLDVPLTADRVSPLVDFVADPASGDGFDRLLDDAADADPSARLWAWIRARVTRRQYNALRLCYGEGKSQDEAADALGLSRQGVSARVTQGLARLQKAAQEPGGKQVFHAGGK